ncbi:hypothetical protein ALC62_08197 [Cyphomyrmex costatus]|uniref:Uncharacterized protein n=1 Tax=Cyphomyrmex costatus TaxID=456900 RepID=A0A195CJR6_9HYME|nr:hypothetical protein ALC62_08197 [Cyphomyrmex costatus]
MGKVQNGKWVLHELSERAVDNRYNICLLLLGKEKKYFMSFFRRNIRMLPERWKNAENDGNYLDYNI